MSLLGHDDAWRQWRDAMRGERMHHAWLLAGRKGLGKANFARAASRALVGTGEGTGPHPDILTLTHEPKDEKEERKRDEGKPFELARSIRITQIRAMQQRLTTRPTVGDRRAVIIDPADDLERSAANALLKSLEEPPVGTFFLLVAHRPEGLLPTIRSRCRMLRFPALQDADLERALRDLAPQSSDETRRAAILAASGSPGAALAFVAMDLGRVAQLFERLLTNGDRDFGLRGELASAIGARPDRERTQAVLDLARAALAARLDDSLRDPRPVIEAHGELVRLTTESTTFNYDPGLLVMEIGTLLARAAPASERANG